MAKDIKVSLHHYLTGKTKVTSKTKKIDETGNADLVASVLEKVRFHYGDRPVHIINEARLLNASERYPDYYSVGWFISSDFKRELVIVDHGSSLESARKALFYSVSSVDWANLAKSTGTV